MTFDQLKEILSEEPFASAGFLQVEPTKAQPHPRFVGRLHGYKLEVECKPSTLRVHYGWNTVASLTDLLLPYGITPKSFKDFPNDLDGLDGAEHELLSLVDLIEEVVGEAGLPKGNGAVKQVGVTFADTNFAGYGERDFMAALVQIQKAGYASPLLGVGSNLGFEYALPSTGSRVDAVEFDEAGNVTAVIECQSGIQFGAYLDDEHFAKIISRYPQSPEIRDTVRDIVVIAGGFTEAQLSTFAQLPYNFQALQTTVVDGKIVLDYAH